MRCKIICESISNHGEFPVKIMRWNSLLLKVQIINIFPVSAKFTWIRMTKLIINDKWDDVFTVYFVDATWLYTKLRLNSQSLGPGFLCANSSLLRCCAFGLVNRHRRFEKIKRILLQDKAGQEEWQKENKRGKNKDTGRGKGLICY
jgi:hypothetical protein